jgi:hypothetical protein
LSVIVAASDSGPAVARTIASLRSQVTRDRIEIVVAAATDRIAPTEPPPGVRWVAAEPGSGVPRLRRLGLDQARGAIAVFTEDSCLFGPDWVASWMSAFEARALSAATGPVEPAMGDAALDWAVFFCEYAPFLRPLAPRAGPPPRLAGNNFALRVTGLAPLERAEIQESDIHRELVRRGATIAEAAGALARHVRRYGWREAVWDRLRFGVEFGRLRARRHPRLVNAGALLAGPAIFAVQLGRLAAVVARARRHRRRFLASLPITVVLLTAWSLGESLGWMWGPGPRRSAGNGCGRAGQTRGQATGRIRQPRGCTGDRGPV